MAGPKDVGLGLLQVRLQGLILEIAGAQQRVELQFAQAQRAHLGTAVACALGVGIGQAGAQAAGRRVAEDDQDALGMMGVRGA
ncbi:hypothetical protein, partial [Klebsiella pneumoniae]|uniref:hypothetical protein n=1 Tax=Klebsiella pneumoniae TaxID=573 RepID=UPI00272F5B6D